MTNEQNQTVRFEMNGQGPSNTKAADSDAVKASPSIQAVIAQSEFGKLQRVGNSYWDASMEFGEYDGSRKSKPHKVTETDG